MEYYNAREAAPLLQLCERTVRKRIKETGEIIAEKVGREFRIPQSEIDRIKIEGSEKEAERESVEAGKAKAEKRKMESGKVSTDVVLSAEWLMNLKGDVEGLKVGVAQVVERLGRLEDNSRSQFRWTVGSIWGVLVLLGGLLLKLLG